MQEQDIIIETPDNFDNEIDDIIKSSFVPKDTRPIYEWASEHVNLHGEYSPPGKFDCNISPWFKQIFDAYQDPSVREVSILAPPRSGKTLVAEICLLHSIANSAGNILWLQETDDKAADMSSDRMVPLLQSCKPVADLIDVDSKYNITDGKYKFLHSKVTITSPKPATLNSKGYIRIFPDEVWTYKGEATIEKIKTRTKEFKGLSKILFFSQGGEKYSAWYKQFISGEIYEWGWKCPKCAELQVLEFNKKQADGTYAGIHWADNSTTRDESGRWNIKECAKQAALKCCKCKHLVTEEYRKQIVTSGEYIRTNAGADVDSTVKSFRYNSIVNSSFEYLVKKYLTAKAEEYNGVKDLLENWTITEMADWWDEHLKNKRAVIRISDYDTSKPFGDLTTFTFLTVDVQEKQFYYVARAWTTNGESRLVAFGTCNTWSELDNVRDRHKIDYRFVFVDTGNKPNEENLYAECVKRGRDAMIDGEWMWACYISTKGSGLKFFKDNQNRRFNTPEQYPIRTGGEDDEVRLLTHVTFSSFRMSQILETLRDGKGKKWEAADVNQEYTDHLNSTFKQQNFATGKWEYAKTNKGVPDHYWDCEKLQILAADIYDCLGVGELTVEPDQSLLAASNN